MLQAICRSSLSLAYRRTDATDIGWADARETSDALVIVLDGAGKPAQGAIAWIEDEELNPEKAQKRPPSSGTSGCSVHLLSDLRAATHQLQVAHERRQPRDLP